MAFRTPFRMGPIITATEKIDGSNQLKDYLLENLETFENNAVFVILGGHHHSKSEGQVTVGKTDTDHTLSHQNVSK